MNVDRCIGASAATIDRVDRQFLDLRGIIDVFAPPDADDGSLKDYIDIFEELEREQERLGADGDRAAGFALEEMDDLGRH